MLIALDRRALLAAAAARAPRRRRAAAARRPPPPPHRRRRRRRRRARRRARACGATRGGVSSCAERDSYGAPPPSSRASAGRQRSLRGSIHSHTSKCSSRASTRSSADLPAPGGPDSTSSRGDGGSPSWSSASACVSQRRTSSTFFLCTTRSPLARGAYLSTQSSEAGGGAGGVGVGAADGAAAGAGAAPGCMVPKFNSVFDCGFCALGAFALPSPRRRSDMRPSASKQSGLTGSLDRRGEGESARDAFSISRKGSLGSAT